MTSTVNLDRLSLSSGQGKRLDVPIRPDALQLGGQEYEPAPAHLDAQLDVSRTTGGHAFRLRFPLRLEGPCMRCLEEAGVDLEVEAREVDQPAAGDEDLSSPYVREGELDVSRWARDAIILALPPQLLCRGDCAGLCAVCGESLNDADPRVHEHTEAGDPRWAKLRELQGE
ncbi:MAG TPA: DUF177 domain-containing protein [Solirubrobacterales bacterium]|nr:DUF177 domain-containing protein [Solirubrobacterales bacterium]